ncbi:MAG: DUF5011 domain-containing protein, partial [Verrucomicrobia bacterium]|nr:DUF5011 domain-containing protein [Verrucomicrobiota bacterium]
AFLAGTDTVYVVGDFGPGNIWNTTANLLTDLDSDGIYEGTVAVTSAGLANLGFKYLIGGKIPENSGYENGSNRALVAAPAGTTPADRTLTTVSFANASATREVTFLVNMSVAQASGVFDPATDTVEVAGTFSNNFGTGYALSAPDVFGICSLTRFLDGPAGTAVSYKFRIKRGSNYNWEADPDRTFNLGAAYVVGPFLGNSPQVLAADYFNRTGQTRSLTYKVDMGVQINKGLFADGDTLEVRFGDFASSGKTLAREGTSTVYSGTFIVPGDAGTVHTYKFWKMNASTTAPFERVDAPRGNNLLNRIYTLGSSGVAATITPTPYFGNDDGIGPVISLTGSSTLNLKVGDAYVELGATASDAIEGNVTATPSGAVDTNSAGTYTVTYNANDANGNAATPVTRTVVVGSTFASWSAGAILNSENLAKYAIGGAINLSVEGAQPTSALDGTSLSITAIVRTDDTTLTVVGQAVTNLVDYATPGLVVEVVGDATGIDQAGVPIGCKKKKFSVPRAGDGRKFLRLNATLAP